jgi:acyl-CoA thioester hydrolase
LQFDASFLGLDVRQGRVLPEWIDVNGHMNVAYYTLAFDQAIDTLWDEFGITEDHIRDTNSSTFAAEMHITYKRELLLDELFLVTAQVLAFSEKGIHSFLRMYHCDERSLVASAECVNLHVDLGTRRVVAWPGHILEQIRAYTVAQGDVSKPAEAGRIIQLSNPLFSTAGVGR